MTATSEHPDDRVRPDFEADGQSHEALDASAVPPQLPNDLRLPEGAGEVLLLLERLWLASTPESITLDVDRARRLAAEAVPEDADLAARFVAWFERLERWLRDV